MQEWFLKEWEKADWLGEEILGKFAFYNSSSEEMSRKGLAKLDRAIEKEKENAKSYRLTGLLQQKLAVLEQLPDAETEVERFFEDYGNIPEIRMIYAFGESSVNEKFTFFRDYNGALTYINTDNISVIELPLVQTESAIFRVQMAALEGENMVSTTEDN